jgi:hypothetical protein
MAANMKYGWYTFDPTPLMSMEKSFNRTDDKLSIGQNVNVTLEGTLVAVSNGEGGIEDVDTKMDSMRNAFAHDGSQFKIWCDDESTPWFSGHPSVMSINFNQSPDNWVFTAPYVIELHFVETSPQENYWTWAQHYLESISETISFEPNIENSPFTWVLDGGTDRNPSQYRVEHTISAVGQRVYSSGAGYTGIAGIWEAEEFVKDYLSFEVEQYVTGLYNVDFTALTGLNHARSVNMDIYNGTYNLTESWIYLDKEDAGFHGNAIEDFTISVVKGASDNLTKVSVEGEIQGLELRKSTYHELDITRYQAASGYWENVKSLIYPRAKYIGAAETREGRDIHVLPINETVAHSPHRGVISYSYEYNDRPVSCYTGALQESIVITDNRQVDVFASIVVPGRTLGPVLQDMNTKTAPTRTVSVDSIIRPTTECPTATDNVSVWFNDSPTAYYDTNLIQVIESNISDNYGGNYFKTHDTESWDGSNGRYNRTTTWTFLNCT